MVIQPGDRVGAYVVQTVTVLDWMPPKVMAVEDGRLVELFMVRLSEKDYPRWEQEFERMRALGKSAHPNIRRIHDVGSHGPLAWVALEPVHGELFLPSSDALRPWEDVRERMREVGAAVVAMEDLGLRADFGPADIAFGDDGRVRVDFESRYAERLASPEHEQLSRPLPWQAPEQWHERTTDRSCQFVFCMIYWRLLFGELPFRGDSSMGVAKAILEGRIAKPPADRDDVPGWLVRALERGLSVEPDARWPSMRELLETIDRGDDVLIQPGEHIGAYVVETHCDLEWVPTCMAVKDGQRVELSFFRLGDEVVRHQRWAREFQVLIQALGKLVHPNIRVIHDYGSHGRFAWLALEPVHEWPGFPGPYPWQDLRERMREVAAAVNAMQDAQLRAEFGMDHIGVGDDGRVRVDFASRYASRLAFSDDLPTPWQAPEQFRGEAPTERSYQFVFCMVYWRLLFGRMPFRGNDMTALAKAMLNDERPEPPVERDVPGWLVRVLDRGLSVEPNARWPSMRELVETIDQRARWLGWLHR